MKYFGTIFFTLAMLFLAWVVVASSPLERLNRGCEPVHWFGKAAASIAAMGSASAEARTKVTVDQAFDGCRVFWFRQFYADEWAALKESKENTDVE